MGKVVVFEMCCFLFEEFLKVHGDGRWIKRETKGQTQRSTTVQQLRITGIVFEDSSSVEIRYLSQIK